MKPEYEIFRGERKDPKESATVRLPVSIKAEAERFALAEGDHLTGLMIEGLARVIEDRKQDPEWEISVREAVAKKVSDLEMKLADAKVHLDSLPPAPQI